MAVVVTTPAPALPAARVREARARLGPERLAGVAAAGLTALLIGGGLARGVPDDGWLSWASRGLTATAWLVLLATAAAALVLWLAVEAQRQRSRWAAALVQATLVLGLATLLEAGVGVAGVLSGVPASSELLHLGLGLGVWVSAVRVLALAGQPAPVRGMAEVAPAAPRRPPSTPGAYLQLTKPPVMTLLP